jgi:hypothetical protein
MKNIHSFSSFIVEQVNSGTSSQGRSRVTIEPQKVQPPYAESTGVNRPVKTVDLQTGNGQNKVVQISNKTNINFKKYLNDVPLDILSIDSNKSILLLKLDELIGCATFVNKFSDAVEIVGNAWLSRDKINGTTTYDIFTNLSERQIETCIKLWNSIYARTTNKKWIEGHTRTAENIRKLVKSLIGTKQINPQNLKIGDICGIFYPLSTHQEEAFFEAGEKYLLNKGVELRQFNKSDEQELQKKSWTMNTHVGIVGAIENGNPVIFHAIPQKIGSGTNIWADGIDQIQGGGQIVWVKRPSSQQHLINI